MPANKKRPVPKLKLAGPKHSTQEPEEASSLSPHFPDKNLYGEEDYVDDNGQLLVDVKSDLLGPMKPQWNGKKCLVLDLDETLVHSSFSKVSNPDFTVDVELDGKIHKVYVLKRPFLDVFLATIKPLFEVVMFTASMQQYADPVCDQIDRVGAMDHRLFRDSCVCFQRNFFKDLTALGRDLDQICIVDNSPLSFARQLANALQIRSWYSDKSDRALLELIPYLTGMAVSESARDYLATEKPESAFVLAAPDKLMFDFDGDLTRFDDQNDLPQESSEEGEEEEEYPVEVGNHSEYVNSQNFIPSDQPEPGPRHSYGKSGVIGPLYSNKQPSAKDGAAPTYLMHQKPKSRQQGQACWLETK
ncbi:CTD (Carboxy-terminal domain, RNA polymerase II, polypeptide A) small [Cichlidogyrus casuarinus]|uniref:CTD (Carboxy-terminal domain, RNA polymerase II, polypeptide A) small n=1 Tax=Cichlidogyrus casuarinus TaxID=1844966 RepID=A0ABD2QJG6_9PLAT